MSNAQSPVGLTVVASLCALWTASACSSSSPSTSSPKSDAGPTGDAGAASDGGPTGDAAADAPPMLFCDGSSCTATKIEHVVIIVQENHTFDSYFGAYCTAPTGSNPTCTTGPACCEAAPAAPPGADGGFVTLDDTENLNYDPNHQQACELQEIDNGAMDDFGSAPATGGVACGSPENIAMVKPPAAGGSSVVQAYWNLAASGALADRYFQPLVGQSSSNDMYLAAAKWEFDDNAYVPDSLGSQCTNFASSPSLDLKDTNVGDLLNDAGVSWAFYAGGYKSDVAGGGADGGCGAPDPLCPSVTPIPTLDCVYAAGDNPFAYYVSTRDVPANSRDAVDFPTEISSGKLPSVAFVKPLEAFTEHPGSGNISNGVTFVQGVVSAIQSSPYASSTLIVLTWDEGGGYYDHVAPPPNNPADQKPYGTRLPTLFIGPFAKANTVTHKVMEHSSLVKFIEYNWLKGVTGQLGNRDTNVNNIGSALDPTATGVAVP